MKRTISFENLKRYITESMVTEADMEEIFKEFAESFYDDLLGNTNIDRNILDKMVEKQLSDKWEAYDRDGISMLSLDVKGYGLGNWKAFNKNNRAEKAGISIEDYANHIQLLNSDFFNNWDATFRKNFGVDLYTAGRSGGHWGFKLRDLIYKVFEPNMTAIRELFDKITKNASEEELMFPDDLVYGAMNLINYYDDFDKYVMLSKEFVDMLEDFSSDVKTTSEKEASQDFNDTLFDDFEPGIGD